MQFAFFRNVRGSRLKICKEDFSTSPAKVFCFTKPTLPLILFAQQLNFVRLFTATDLIKADVHDVNYLKDVITAGALKIFHNSFSITK